MCWRLPPRLPEGGREGLDGKGEDEQAHIHSPCPVYRAPQEAKLEPRYSYYIFLGIRVWLGIEV